MSVFQCIVSDTVKEIWNEAVKLHPHDSPHVFEFILKSLIREVKGIVIVAVESSNNGDFSDVIRKLDSEYLEN
jgi:hypothetical protein